MIAKGIIVSIQGYTQEATQELSEHAVNAGAVAIRTDRPIKIHVPIVGLTKEKVQDRKREPYITIDLEMVKEVNQWANYIAVDFRKINKNRKQISEYCRCKGIKLIADIATFEDFQDIVENDFYFNYVATTLSVLKDTRTYNPDLSLVRKIKKLDCNVIIAEGNYQTRNHVREAYEAGANNVCIGSAISDIYKLTKKFASVRK